MTDDSTNAGIEKLDKENYQPWKFRMSNYLMGKGLWGYVTGEERKPKLPEEGVTPDDLKAQKTWNERDKKVMFLVPQNMSKIGNDYIKGCLGNIGEALYV